MKTRICLLIVYNHNYESNIDILDRLYAHRFSAVYHIMPFYRGSRKNVIGVYECSYQFSGYLTQAYKIIARNEYTHYVMVADDMCLNPKFTEDTLISRLGMNEDEAFITNFRPLTYSEFLDWRGWAVPGVLNMQGENNATEWRKFLPDKVSAEKSFGEHGIDCEKLVSVGFVRRIRGWLCVDGNNPYKVRVARGYLPLVWLMSCFEKFYVRKRERIYPLVRGYSDFLIVPSCVADAFFHCCGVFAAMRQFVEISIPTALLLSCKRVKTIKDVGLKSDPPGDGVLRLSQFIEERYERSFKKFMGKFPEDYLFIHPVKLSHWGEFL